jgi:hypothetical protein
MILMNSTVGRGFVACAGAITPKDGFIHANDSSGVANQWIYVFSGTAKAITETGDVIMFRAKELIDMSQWMGMKLTYTDEGEGTQYVAINPVPNTRRYTAELLRGPVQKTVVGTEKLMNIVGLEHVTICNGAPLQSRNFATVPEGKQVLIDVPEGAVAAVFTEV